LPSAFIHHRRLESAALGVNAVFGRFSAKWLSYPNGHFQSGLTGKRLVCVQDDLNSPARGVKLPNVMLSPEIALERFLREKHSRGESPQGV
jgi:hypothetical protein